MSEDNKFWLVVWGILASTILGILGMVTVYSVNQDSLIAEAIAKGASSHTIFCAYRADGYTKAICGAKP